ncbi:MAG: phosphoribosylanthranilate isomerase [Gammaproteobacteria bacterium]|nr:phosphoribosylanthranilate isomerase [Gammaproteobacteria bacterium]
MNPVKVKICGLTRSADVAAAVENGADALGFVFAPSSKRVLTAQNAAGLVARVPAFVCRTGLFMDQDAAAVASVLEQVPLNLLQFHGAEEADFCGQFGLPYIKAVSMDSEQAMQRAEREYPDAAALLLDSHAAGGVGGTGRVFDWSLIAASGLPLVLAGGLNPGNVRQAVEQVRPWAVDVSSGVETAPGIKSETLMCEFIKEAKREY